jgi:hypothetical protein
MPTSGAMGTILELPELGGDVTGMIESLAKTLRGENKVGYGGATQMTIKREWFEKIREEAERTRSIPYVALKFTSARGPTRHVIAFDFDAFAEIALRLNELYESNKRLVEEVELLKGNE